MIYKKAMTILLFLSATLLCSFNVANGATINSLSESGNKITLIGESFGSTGEPAISETFEFAPDGTTIPNLTTSSWTGLPSCDGGQIDTDNSFNGHGSGFGHITNTWERPNSYCTFTPSDNIYVSMVWYLSPVDGFSYGWGKGPRIQTTESDSPYYGYEGGFNYAYQLYGFPDSQSSRFRIDASESGDDGTGGGLPNMAINDWTRIEIFIDQGTEGNNDAECQIFFHANNEITEVTRSGFNLVQAGRSWQYEHVMLPMYIENPYDSKEYKIWVDDFLAKGDRSRIEIGNASTFDACTKRVLQMPESWSDTEVSFTLASGDLSKNDSWYAFVVDSSGVASNGVELSTPKITGLFVGRSYGDGQSYGDGRVYSS